MTTPDIVWQTGDPSEPGRYLVTDGESVGIDTWIPYIRYPGSREWKVRLPSQWYAPAHPDADVEYRWSKYRNVTHWSAVAIGDGSVI